MAERVQHEQYMDSETPKEALLPGGATQPMQSVVKSSSTSEIGSQDSHTTKKSRVSEQKGNVPKPSRGNAILESVFGDGN